MIEWAAARCGHLVVFVNTGTRDAAPGDLRVQWLAELHPDVTVVQVRHELATDFADESLWARWIALFRDHWPLPNGPHVVFSSDPYVAELARRLGAEPVLVDPERRTVPVSATQIRADPAAYLHRLAAPVRAWVEKEWL
jgi:nicotinamide mononucleotide adenylyltransferase